jgi:hypothetical protein
MGPEAPHSSSEHGEGNWIEPGPEIDQKRVQQGFKSADFWEQEEKYQRNCSKETFGKIRITKRYEGLAFFPGLVLLTPCGGVTRRWICSTQQAPPPRGLKPPSSHQKLPLKSRQREDTHLQVAKHLVYHLQLQALGAPSPRLLFGRPVAL